jgi:hypothetical protein
VRPVAFLALADGDSVLATGRTLGACGRDIGIVEEKRCERLPRMPLNMEDGLRSYLGRLRR